MVEPVEPSQDAVPASCENCGATGVNLNCGEWWTCRDQKVDVQKLRSGLKTTTVTTTTSTGIVGGAMALCSGCVAAMHRRRMIQTVTSLVFAAGLFFADYWIIAHYLVPQFRGNLDLLNVALLIAACVALAVGGLVACLRLVVSLSGVEKPADHLAAQLKEVELRKQGYELVFPGPKPENNVDVTSSESWHV